MSQWPLLSLLIWLPILGGLLLLGFTAPRFERCARWGSLVIASVSLVLSGVLYAGFDTTTAIMQFQENVMWVDALNIHYALGIDGIALPLILLTNFCSVLVVIAGWEVIQQRVAQYYAAFLIMQGILCGVFAATDAILFYVFFEAMLIPMFLIIGIWGGPNRIYATIKSVLYTFLGSVFMLIALIYLFFQSAGSFSSND